MGKKKKTDPRIELINHYKKYVSSKGKLPQFIMELAEYGQVDFIEFKKHFKSLEELEVALLLWYFKNANDLLVKDKQADEWDPKDRHIAFLYLLIESMSKDEAFLHEFIDHKKSSSTFTPKFMYVLNKQDFEAIRTDGKMTEVFDKISINPKKAALTNHALGAIIFYLKDKSEDKQDSDAFIEKTSDLLFRLTDTSTLQSIFDLGKFMATRKNEVFTWD